MLKTLKPLWILAVLVILRLVAAPSGPLAAEEKGTFLQAQLTGFEQVQPVNTTGSGKFRAQINADGTVSYELTYSNLSMTGVVLFADIHFGQKHFTPNGIILLLCSNQTGTMNPGGATVVPGT